MCHQYSLCQEQNLNRFPVGSENSNAGSVLLDAGGIRWRVRKLFAEAGFYDAGDTPDEEHRGDVQQARTEGLRRACIRGFHSFRVTWVTLALNANVPMELVIRVTSHKTVEVVKAHYFKPGREDFRRALEDKLPLMFALGKTRSKESILADLLKTIRSAVGPLNEADQRETYVAIMREIASCGFTGSKSK